MKTVTLNKNYSIEGTITEISTNGVLVILGDDGTPIKIIAVGENVAGSYEVKTWVAGGAIEQPEYRIHLRATTKDVLDETLLLVNECKQAMRTIESLQIKSLMY